MIPSPISVLLVDDHTLFRAALMRLIKTLAVSVTFHEASNGREALLLLKSNSFDVTLLDIQMPECSGIEVMKELRETAPFPRIIALTQFNEGLLISYLLQLGVFGFLNKSCSPEELETALITVSQGNYYYDKIALSVIHENIGKEKHLGSIAISHRELQVMSLMKDGKTNKEISSLLKLSLRTIESYRKALMKKTHCRNVAEVVRLAYRTGLEIR